MTSGPPVMASEPMPVPNLLFQPRPWSSSAPLSGAGPTLVSAQTMRMHGHGLHDDARYVPPEQLAEWTLRDPIELQSKRVAALGVDVEALAAEVRDEVDRATEEALAMALPDPASATTGVFCVGEPVELGVGEAPWSGFR